MWILNEMYWKFSSVSWDSLPLNGSRVKWRHEVKWVLPPLPSSMWRMWRARQYWASGHSGKAGNWGSGRLVIRTGGGNSPRAICSTVEHFHKEFKGTGLRYCSCGYIRHPQTHSVVWKFVSTFCAPLPSPLARPRNIPCRCPMQSLLLFNPFTISVLRTVQNTQMYFVGNAYYLLSAEHGDT